MKTRHIILLVALTLAIVVLVSFIGDLSTYETVGSAKAKPGRFVHIVARLDKSRPIEYNALKNPNHLSFMVVDSLGQSIEVVYNHVRPDNLERSEKLVLKGIVRDDRFECSEILMKCPSKYKDNPVQVEEGLANPQSGS